MNLTNLFTLLLLSLVTLAAGWQQTSSLKLATYQGKLSVAMRLSPAVFYEHEAAGAGFEYELVKGFADQLGLQLDVQLYANAEQMEEAVLTGKAHLAAGNLGLTQSRAANFLTSQALETSGQLVVYRAGYFKPRSWQDITATSSLAVLSKSAEAQALASAQEAHPNLSWLETNQLDAAQLLQLVHEGELDYALVNTQDFNINRFHFSRLSQAFAGEASTQLVWLFNQQKGSSLAEAANNFISQATASGLLAATRQKYYGYENYLNFTGAQLFLRRIATNLSQYESHFKEAAAANDLDWTLLAALSFQESHWLPLARSPTGVRGIMMLTQATANELQVDRLNAQESIEGGARYLKSLLTRIPQQVKGEQRLLLAMAAYNIGLGHVEDARRLTQGQGFNPNLWEDVAKHLPLLTQRKWYSRTRYGYARGHEAVTYVENIRRYTQILKWHQLSQPNQLKLANQLEAAQLETAFQLVPAEL